jgi:hypothetical protein
MIAMNREGGYGHIHVRVLVVDGREAVCVQCHVQVARVRCSHEYDGALPSSGSDKSSISIGRSPSVYSRSRASVWKSVSRDGRFSWKRSPAMRIMSTFAHVVRVSQHIRRKESTHLLLHRKLQDLAEGIDAVLPAHRVALVRAKMAVRRE